MSEPNTLGTVEPIESADFGAEVAELRERLVTQSAALDKLTGMFNTMFEHISSQRREPEPKAAAEPQWPEDEEFERMPRRQAFDMLIGRVVDAVQKQVGKKLDDRINSVETAFRTSTGQSMLDRARDKYKDFGDWEKELIPILENMKQPDLDSAYRLVRAMNPDKAKKLDAQHAPKPAANDDDELLKIAPARPGAKGGTPKMGDLSLTDAVNAAFAKLGPDMLAAQEREMER